MNCTHVFNQRIEERYIIKWTDEINSQNKLTYYVKNFKCYFEHKLYIDVLEDKFRKALSRFRLASHSLEIETGRYINLDRMERKCKYCSMNIVESEFHFLCICPLYRDLRTKYQIPTSFNTILTFSKLLSSKSVRTIRNVSKFVYFAMLRRTDTTNTFASN